MSQYPGIQSAAQHQRLVHVCYRRKSGNFSQVNNKFFFTDQLVLRPVFQCPVFFFPRLKSPGIDFQFRPGFQAEYILIQSIRGKIGMEIIKVCQVFRNDFFPDPSASKDAFHFRTKNKLAFCECIIEWFYTKTVSPYFDLSPGIFDNDYDEHSSQFMYKGIAELQPESKCNFGIRMGMECFSLQMVFL